MKVKTLDEYLTEAIEAYTRLEKEAAKLADELSTLTPQELNKRCSDIQHTQQKLTQNSENLIEILKLAGQDACSNPLLFTHHSIIEKTIKTYDRIADLGATHKNVLASELQKLKQGRKGMAGYCATTESSGKIIQRRT